MVSSQKYTYKRDLFFYSVFAIAMAYLESAVVVYLREIYYPNGFEFPLVPLSIRIYATETGREAATIIMLWAASGIRSKNRGEWFALFMFNFALWDIWYYIWLKILVNWPVTLLDWDILFLIPLPWTGPVLAPVLISLILIFASVTMLRFENSGIPFLFTIRDIALGIVAGSVILGSFLWQTGDIAAGKTPEFFPWWIFSAGTILGVFVFLARYQQLSSTRIKPPEKPVSRQVNRVS
jgi:hypothetical protein